MKENLKMKGHYTIEARDARTGKLVHTWEIDNLLTAVNRTIRAQMLAGEYTGDGTEIQIKYFAFGTGSTAPTVDDTQLESEVYRKQITQISVESGVVTSVVSLGASECNYIVREIGVFCGSSATAAANSGLLISRALVFVDKNTNLVLNVIRRDICTI